jgi:cellulose synthase/poly-beta-1,6-N-acetylglucosamine synthase-like glycosyltransferase
MSVVLQTLANVFWVVLIVAQIILALIFIYYFIIGIFGWFRRKEKPAESFKPVNKFALLIAAHNEEKVIGSIVRNLKELNYPQNMYDIFVIADNCNDKTAKVATENGARVFERFDETKKGKGFSLEWMFKKIFKMETKYDAVCIFDADNLASSNFLMEMNKELCLGNKVIQGYLDSKNPEDSWISGNYSMTYWISNRIFQLPRHYLGLNCALGGTGFVMSMDVLQEIGWGATCLTEDLEFSLRLVLRNMRVSWSHNARVYDEKPLKLKQSWRQRKRWMQGHCDCAGRYLKQLFVKAFKDKDFRSFDCALYLMQPYITIANGVVGLLTIIMLIVLNSLTAFMIISSIVSTIALMLFSLIFVVAEGKLKWKVIKYFILFPLYGLTWIPITIQGYFNRNEHEWLHTVHTRAIDISDIEKLGKVG